MQRFVVFFLIVGSLCYLAASFIQSIRAKKKGHCSGCGKE